MLMRNLRFLLRNALCQFVPAFLFLPLVGFPSLPFLDHRAALVFESLSIGVERSACFLDRAPLPLDGRVTIGQRLAFGFELSAALVKAFALFIQAVLLLVEDAKGDTRFVAVPF